MLHYLSDQSGPSTATFGTGHSNESSAQGSAPEVAANPIRQAMPAPTTPQPPSTGDDSVFSMIPSMPRSSGDLTMISSDGDEERPQCERQGRRTNRPALSPPRIALQDISIPKASGVASGPVRRMSARVQGAISLTLPLVPTDRWLYALIRQFRRVSVDVACSHRQVSHGDQPGTIAVYLPV